MLGKGGFATTVVSNKRDKGALVNIQVNSLDTNGFAYCAILVVHLVVVGGTLHADCYLLLIVDITHLLSLSQKHANIVIQIYYTKKIIVWQLLETNIVADGQKYRPIVCENLPIDKFWIGFASKMQL